MYTDVNRDGEGVAEFGREDDYDFAVKNMDGLKFESHTVSLIIAVMPSYVRRDLSAQ